jgi:hypothetical protein
MIRLNKIVVDGMFFNDLPSKLDQIIDEDYGVRLDSHRTLNHRRVIVTETAQTATPNNYRQKRKIHQQAWRFGWDTESFMTPALAGLINELYETQKPFWIQADDEMSRCWGRCLTVGNDIFDNLTPHAYFTPTYPIFPYGHEPGEDSDVWPDSLMVEGKLWDGYYTVDRETGLVLIEPERSQFNHRTKVHFKYTWRAYVRIKSVEIYAYQLAQTYYVGDVVFEQVPIPVMGAELAWREEPYTRSCFYFSDNRIKVFSQLRLVGRVGVPKIIRGIKAFGAVRVGGNATAGVYGGSGNPTPKYGVGYGRLIFQSKTNGASSGTSSTMLRPDGDLNTTWTTTTTSRWDAINEAIVDEADYIVGGSTAQTGTLSPGVDPGVNTAHILNVSWRRAPSITTTLTAQLLQGALVIATAVFTATSDGRIDSTYTLTTTEAGNITDYTDLRWSVASSTAALVFALWVQIPTLGGIVTKTRSVTGQLVVTATAKNYRSIISASLGVNPVVIRSTVIATKSGHIIDNPGGEPGLPE